jgi:hypothetical protein
MKLAKLSAFRELVYAEGSAPSLNTLRARISNKQIPGGCVEHGHYYVDLDEFDRATNYRARLIAEQKELAADPLVAGLF